jgi:hypothetical protein
MELRASLSAVFAPDFDNTGDDGSFRNAAMAPLTLFSRSETAA